MDRSTAVEIADTGVLTEAELEQVHRELTWTNKWLGNTGAIIRRIQRGGPPVRRILDIGCGCGGMLREIRQRLNVDVIGVDRNVPRGCRDFAIVETDAVTDRLPEADVAICVYVAHHLTEAELEALIRNVRRSCRRLILLDLVRSQRTLRLFRWFVGPFLSRINRADGYVSIQRSYTPAEFFALISGSLGQATFTQEIYKLGTHQIADIVWEQGGFS